MVTLAGPAVKFTCCWPKVTTAPKRRRPITRVAAFRIALILWVLIAFLVVSWFPLQCFVNRKFPGIHQHHHQHAAGENIVGGNLALVVRVPHESKASLGGRVVRYGSRGRSRACRSA